MKILPALRPWRQAGIAYLLLDDATSQRWKEIQQQAAEKPVRRMPPPEKPSVQQPPQERRSAPVVAEAIVRPSAEAGAAPLQSSKKQALPPEQWPAYWRDLLSRTPPSPALVWTYPALSRDLGGDADDAHRNLLRRLLRDMALPKGSHAFWPLNPYPYPEGCSEQTIDATLFLSGIAHLKPDTVILMTGTAPPELALADVRPLTPMIVEGRRFVVTPHVDALLENSSRYAQLMTFLKSLLRQM